ncbi:MAG TPA: alpha/beta fold hydrolase [Candidatus Dojkabacteria bacterium]|nr:alpha/beta fold hydrolase [Candidatus Dojkabacteria bacterium]
MKKLQPKRLIFLITALAIIAVSGSYILQKYFKDSNNNKTSNEESEVVDENKDEYIKQNQTPPVTPKIKYDEQPVNEDATYFEKYPVIEGQQAYITFPIEIDPESPPYLVIYNHGSNTNVTTNTEDPFMKDMMAYGRYFAMRGYGFAASNQHGMNYGNQASIDDITKTISWFKENYKIQDKVNLLGFSMGGLPAIYFTVQNRESVNSLALLAPVTYVWGSNIYKPLENIPITIWHGVRDVNVGYVASTGFIERGKPYDLNIELRSISGAGHFDVDTEYMEEIYNFFEQNQ